jgi:S-adenosylmethionine synthetase
MGYLFTSESVSEGHPDKLADQISDALLDEFLRHDPDSKVACETLVTTGLITLAGEVRTQGYVEVQDIARKVANEVGYTKASYMFSGDSCGVISAIHEQSPDIRQGVDRAKPEEQGAGDQGIMFGYACNEMDNFMPMPVEIAHMLLQELAVIRKEGKKMKYLGPDAKSQVTIEYSERGKPVRVHTIVVSTQHDEFIVPGDKSPEMIKWAEERMQEIIRNDIERHLIPRVKKSLPAPIRKLFRRDYKLLVNPTGKFIIGGPHGDTGLTGRKIIVDTYGGRCPHGGGAFSGKDSSKVDRSAAYAARHIAKNMVAAGVASEMLVQISYAIGVAEPVSIYVNTYGTSKLKSKGKRQPNDSDIADAIMELFDLKPYAIVERFGLKNPIYLPTASYGHFGRDSYTGEVEVLYKGKNVSKKVVDGKEKYFKKVTFFPWERIDYVDQIKDYFGI